jgi:predicted transcriptional regulator
MQTEPETVKQAASAVLQTLPDDVTWERVQYHLFVRQQIELGLADAKAGRLLETTDVRKRLDAAKSSAPR